MIPAGGVHLLSFERLEAINLWPVPSTQEALRRDDDITIFFASLAGMFDCQLPLGLVFLPVTASYACVVDDTLIKFPFLDGALNVF